MNVSKHKHLGFVVVGLLLVLSVYLLRLREDGSPPQDDGQNRETEEAASPTGGSIRNDLQITHQDKPGTRAPMGIAAGDSEEKPALLDTFEKLYLQVIDSVERHGQLELFYSPDEMEALLQSHPELVASVITRIRELGSSHDPVSRLLMKAIPATPDNERILKQLVTDLGDKFSVPSNLARTRELLAVALGSSNRGERAEALSRVLESQFSHADDVLLQLKAIAAGAGEPWLRSRVFTFLYFSGSPKLIGDLGKHLSNLPGMSDPIGVISARALFFGKIIKEREAEYVGRIEGILFSELSAVSAKRDSEVALSFIVRSLHDRNIRSGRSVLPYVTRIIAGDHSELVKAAAVDLLAPLSLYNLDFATLDEESKARFDQYRTMTLSFSKSVFRDQNSYGIRDAVVAVYGKLGRNEHIDQIRQWARQNPGLEHSIKVAIDEIQYREKRLSKHLNR